MLPDSKFKLLSSLVIEFVSSIHGSRLVPRPRAVEALEEAQALA